jgi:hypothetical protein
MIDTDGWVEKCSHLAEVTKVKSVSGVGEGFSSSRSVRREMSG